MDKYDFKSQPLQIAKRWQQAPDDNFRVKQKLNRYETRIGIFETKTTDIFRTFHPINNSDISV
ncbi:MAG: hypothetical protein O9294_14165, partial [Cytophagales bacterium]|nr:hypothetical protein [Cytophagales bacterium]